MDAPDPRKGITSVVLEGLVVMKMIKHCQDNYPHGVIGQLLGMDVENRLEITNCYPFMAQPSGPAGDGLDVAAFELEQQQYQRDMMWCIREVNIDHQVVGWYQSTGSQMGSFLTSQWIETQFNYQKQLPNIVCLVYDPIGTQEGSLSVRAYRLTKSFMHLMVKGDLSSLGFANAGVTSASIVESVPVTFHNSTLVGAALVEMEQVDDFTGDNNVDLTRLSISDKPVLEQSMENLIYDLDTLGKEQSKYSYHMRSLMRSYHQAVDKMDKRRQENRTRATNGEDPLPEEDELAQLFEKEPPRLDNKILLKALDSYVDNIKTLAGEGIVKQYGVSAIQAHEE